LVILAQIGCYVPATFMAISPYDSLYTRMGTADSIENNASSFMVEMADMAHMMERWAHSAAGCKVHACEVCKVNNLTQPLH
jgi:DNA mismatch repair ATPase MutS